jgi:hypothetical protein
MPALGTCLNVSIRDLPACQQEVNACLQEVIFLYLLNFIDSPPLNFAGDIVIVVPGKAACDMVLLNGEVVVDETILTGAWVGRRLQHIEETHKNAIGR